ncbi:MAG: hypothetical protein ACKVTZ_07500 [Bacteroidia bacterium]
MLKNTFYYLLTKLLTFILWLIFFLPCILIIILDFIWENAIIFSAAIPFSLGLVVFFCVKLDFLFVKIKALEPKNTEIDRYFAYRDKKSKTKEETEEERRLNGLISEIGKTGE